MKIESKIPTDIPCFAFYASDEKYYNQYGMCGMDAEGLGRSLSPSKDIFMGIDGNDLYFYKIAINEEVKDIVTIDPVEVGERLTYNPEYGELVYNEKYWDRTEECKVYTSVENNGYYMLAKAIRGNISSNYNRVVLYRFFAPILASQPWYGKMAEHKIMMEYPESSNTNVFKMLYIYLAKRNKSFQYLIENEMWNEVKHIMHPSVDDKLLEELYYRIDKKTVKVSKELGVNMTTAVELLEKYTMTDLVNFARLMDALNVSTDSIYSFIKNFEGVNLGEFANYFVRSYFVYDNIDLSLKHYGNDKTKLNTETFFRRYRDYNAMINGIEGADLFPVDLRVAHDAAVDNRQVYQDVQLCDKSRNSFEKKVSLYEDWIFADGDLAVEIPKQPEDLIKESAALHHCVRTYIDSVANGACMIFLIRKEGKPYMTVEINERGLTQAKKTCNQLPNEEDEVFLKKWCKKIKVEIKSY